MKTLIKRNGSVLPSILDDFMPPDFFSAPDIFSADEMLSRFGLSTAPRLNVIEDAENFTVELAVPGFEKKDFKIEVDNGELTIGSEKKKEETNNYRHREFLYQGFSRTLVLPENSLPDKIDAHYENGVLKHTLPKKEVTTTNPKKKIKIA